jgi:fatty acid desaturase
VRDDYSAAFHKVRFGLVDDRGQSYAEFVRGLRPDFARVYRDIGWGYSMLITTALIAIFTLHNGVPPWFVVAIGALSFGYWIAYLQLFIHEAAHANLAAERKESDRLGNLLVAWMVGTTVANYRKVHFEHHRALGTTSDTESSYFLPLNALFVLSSLCGLRAVEVLLTRRSCVQRSRSSGKSEQAAFDAEGIPCRSRASLIASHVRAGVLGHIVVILVAWWGGSWPLATAWCVGVGVVFPFFAALRPVLEHRDEVASSRIDYRRADHGAYTRLFGDDPLSASFGGAGFNRHLLHHWEPQVSYTRLPELEKFLGRTVMKTVMESRRSSYGAAFIRLFTLY